MFRTPKSSQAPFRGPPHVRPLRKRSARYVPLYGARTITITPVGASLCAPATQTFCTMRNFVNKKSAKTKPSLERGGGPHVSVFQFSISIFSALNYKYLLSVNDCGGGVVTNGLFRSLLCSLQKESLHKSHATTHPSPPWRKIISNLTAGHINSKNQASAYGATFPLKGRQGITTVSRTKNKATQSHVPRSPPPSFVGSPLPEGAYQSLPPMEGPAYV